MKISIVISEDTKQIMFTPESEHEKQALKFISPFISPEDDIEIAQKWGTDEPWGLFKKVRKKR